MKILQIAHISEIPGPVQFLARFFSEKGENLFKIYHPLENTRIGRSEFLRGEKIILAKDKADCGKMNYVFDFFLTLRWIRKIDGPIEKAIGMNCFDTLPLILVKFLRLKKIGEIIFFNTDFSRKRFENKILNWIYVFIDRFCARYSDKICCNTRRTIEKRIAEGVDWEKIIYTPNGVFLTDIGEIDERSKKMKKNLIYVGHVSQEHGLEEIIDAISEVSDWTLEIIGDGESKRELIEKIKTLHTEERIRFLGLKSHEETLTHLKNFSGFGIAPYKATEDWVIFCDPVKVKEYVASCVPVIISEVPEMAETIKKENLGFVYGDRKELQEILHNLSDMSDDTYKKYSDRLTVYREKLDLGKIYEKIL